MIFSERLRILIEEKGITQKQVASDLNIAVSTMGGYVQGASEPDFETLKNIANYFGVSTDYLLGMKIGDSENENEEELLRIFRSLSKSQRGIYLEQGRAIIRYNFKEKTRKLSSCKNQLTVLKLRRYRI